MEHLINETLNTSVSSKLHNVSFIFVLQNISLHSISERSVPFKERTRESFCFRPRIKSCFHSIWLNKEPERDAWQSAILGVVYLEDSARLKLFLRLQPGRWMALWEGRTCRANAPAPPTIGNKLVAAATAATAAAATASSAAPAEDAAVHGCRSCLWVPAVTIPQPSLVPLSFILLKVGSLMLSRE